MFDAKLFIHLISRFWFFIFYFSGLLLGIRERLGVGYGHTISKSHPLHCLLEEVHDRDFFRHLEVLTWLFGAWIIALCLPLSQVIKWQFLVFYLQGISLETTDRLREYSHTSMWGPLWAPVSGWDHSIWVDLDGPHLSTSFKAHHIILTLDMGPTSLIVI